MPKLLPLLFLLFLLVSCFGNKSTLENEQHIEQLGTPFKLEYYKHMEGAGFEYEETPRFVISDQRELKIVMKELNSANHPEPWKGAGWDRIKVYYSDTILQIFTNTKKIGFSGSGTFYDLEEENFITKRLN